MISLLIFTMFCQFQIRMRLGDSAALTYYVYVFHTFVYTLLLPVFGDATHELRSVGLVFLLATVISFIIAKLYSILWANRTTHKATGPTRAALR